jgi:RND family efflux transporter MFP subunit
MTARRWLPVLVLALLAGVVVGEQLSRQGETWVRVVRTDLVIGVPLEGTLRSLESAEIGPPFLDHHWDFRISQMVPEGTEVVAGMPVLSFDTSQLNQELHVKISERDSAEKNLEKESTSLEIQRRAMEMELAEARATLRRESLEISVPETLVTRRELEISAIEHDLASKRIDYLTRALAHHEAEGRARLAALQETRDRAAARVKELEETISRMTVRAPRAGTVVYFSSRYREKKKLGDRVWRNSTVLEIPDLSRMRAECEVAEADAGRIAVDQPVTFHLDAYPDWQHTGKVSSIRTTVQHKRHSSRKLVKLEVELDRTDPERMRPGMRLRGVIETDRVAGALVVPHEAVFSRAGGAVVFTRTLLGKHQVAPSFGQRNRDSYEIVSGLEEGDLVMLREQAGGS